MIMTLMMSKMMTMMMMILPWSLTINKTDYEMPCYCFNGPFMVHLCYWSSNYPELLMVDGDGSEIFPLVEQDFH